MIDTMSKVRAVTRDLLQELGREPTAEETAERAKLSLDDARCIMKMARQPLSSAITTTATSASSCRTIAKTIRSTTRISRRSSIGSKRRWRR